MAYIWSFAYTLSRTRQLLLSKLSLALDLSKPRPFGGDLIFTTLHCVMAASYPVGSLVLALVELLYTVNLYVSPQARCASRVAMV